MLRVKRVSVASSMGPPKPLQWVATPALAVGLEGPLGQRYTNALLTVAGRFIHHIVG